MKFKKTFLMLLIATTVLSSCKKDDNDNDNTNTPPVITPDPFSSALSTSSPVFYKATVDGTSQFYTEGKNNVMTQGKRI